MNIFIRILLILMAGFSPLILWACNCSEPENPTQAYERADKIFVGTVIDATTNWMSGGRKYSFEVRESWKSPTDNFIIVNSGWDEDCGFDFKMGEEYLVYSYKKFSLKTDRCSGNKLLAAAEEDLAILGKGSPPTPSQMVTMLYWVITVPVILALLFIGFVVLRKRRST